MKYVIVCFLLFVTQLCVAQKKDSNYFYKLLALSESLDETNAKVEKLVRKRIIKSKASTDTLSIIKFTKGKYTLVKSLSSVNYFESANSGRYDQVFYLENGKLLYYSLLEPYYYNDTSTNKIDTLGYSLDLCYYNTGKVAYQLSNGHGVTENDSFNAKTYALNEYRKTLALIAKYKRKK